MGKPALTLLNQPSAASIERCFAFGPFRVLIAERLLLKNGAAVTLPSKTFDLLVMLIDAAGHLVKRDELMNALWPHVIVEENNLSVHVSALRKALGDEGDAPRYIETVRGHGYRFIAAVAVAVMEARPITPLTPDVATDTLPAGPIEMPERPQSQRRRRVLFSAGAIAVAIALAVGGLLLRSTFRSINPGVDKAPARSIAVLPFENLSADPANRYFASGVQDTILTKLAGISALKVIARASTASYPSRPKDLGSIGRELGVGAVLEGSVQKTDAQVLINVRLIDVQTRAHLWAQVYERPLDHVFGVESDVAGQVAAALEARLLPAETARIAIAPTQDEQAYDYFLQAEYLAIEAEQNELGSGSETVTNAVDLYRKAIARDPRFALAYARLSYLYSYAHWFGADSPPTRVADAAEAARQALELEPGLVEAHLAMGFVLYWGKHDFPAALAEFEKVLETLPGNADAMGTIAAIHRREGRWALALSGLQRAAAVDVRNPLWSEELGTSLMQLRRYKEAVQQFDRAVAVDPRHYFASLRKASALLLRDGDIQATRAVVAKIPRTADFEDNLAGAQSRLALFSGDPDAALAALDHASPWVSALTNYGALPASFLRAEAYASKGDAVHARQSYEEAQRLLKNTLSTDPNVAWMWGTLGLVDAALGENEDALRAGRKAVELTSTTPDALSGPYSQVILAEIEARLGNVEAAVNLLHKLLAMPSGLYVSVALLKIDPAWQPIRDDPRFQALLRDADDTAADKRPAASDKDILRHPTD